MFVDFQTIRFLWPEVILSLCAAWIYLGGTVRAGRAGWLVFSLVAYGLAAAAMLGWEWPAAERLASAAVASGPIVVDALGLVARCAAVFLGALLTLLLARGPRDELATECLGTLMLLTVGVMLVSRANDLVLLFVGLELVSVPTYVLLFLGRRDRATSEATLKYFFLSILSSALLLYGMSFLYGLTGTTTLRAMAARTAADMEAATVAVARVGIDQDHLMYLALVLIVAGLGFRLAVVPFHFYAADVYQGATHANAGLLAVAPKVAGVLAFVRLLISGFPQAAASAWELLLVLAILTMTLGNVCALWQQNLRRLLAYSSIAQGGYILIGLTVALADRQCAGAGQAGVAAALVYVAVYALAVLGSFAALTYLGGVQHEVNGVEELAGLTRTRPLAAAALTVCLFSLAGLPPLAGFWGKLLLFVGAVRTASGAVTLNVSVWFTVLAAAGMLNAAIGAAYYLRVIATMFFHAPHKTLPAQGGPESRAVMLCCAALVVAVGAIPGPTLNLARDAEAALQAPTMTAVEQAAGDPPHSWDSTWHALAPPRTNS